MTFLEKVLDLRQILLCFLFEFFVLFCFCLFVSFCFSSPLRCIILERNRGLESMPSWQVFCPFNWDGESAFFRVTVV